MARRTGISALQDVGRKMCKLITAFRPIIIRVFPESPELHLALDAAMVACQVLHDEIEKVKEYGD